MGKRLGQHFLQSPGVLRTLVEQAALQPGEPVLEVGPGQGALTERLLETGARVAAVEIDPALAQGLRERWGGRADFRLIEGDVLKIDLAPQALFGGSGRYAVIANLPYYLSTPLLFRFIAARAFHSRLLLMVQQEVAERLVALPDAGKVYGSLSIAARCAYAALRIVARVPPGAFRPPPKVHSAVVAFTPLQPVLDPGAERAFLEHVKMLFAARRKRMAGTLARHRPAWPAARLAAAQALVGERRPEALTPDEHLWVYCLLTGLPAASP
jgi:16S rRNA (adenine1518-N6/adenine1519-N6)-dimethyltransferase